MPLRAVLPVLAALLAFLALPRAEAQQAAPGGDGRAREITVANETDRTLQQLFVWRAGTPDQGADRLGADVLPPRASLRVPLGRVRNCNWEVRGIFEDGEEIRRRIDACRTSRAVLAETGPRREVEVMNDSELELRELYLWPPGAREEGADRLGNAVVPPGETFRLRLRGESARGCAFELRAVFADDSEERRERLDLCRAPRIAFGDPDLPLREVPVLNRARRTLRELYAAPSGEERREERAWGPDRLGSSVIAPRESFRLRVRSRGCAFDLRGVFDDDRDEVQRNIDLCVVQGVVFGDQPVAPPRQVTLVNAHRRTIQQAFLSSTESQDWGEDVLGTGVLRPGARFETETALPCRVDVRIVFDTNAAEERRDLDSCATPTLVLRPGWTVEDAAAEKGPEPVPAVPTPALPGAAGAPATPARPAATSPGEPAPAAASPAEPAPAAASPAEPAPAAASPAVPAPAAASPGTPAMADASPPAAPALAPASPPSAAAAAAPPGRGLRLVNRAALPVVELYAQPPGTAERGPDRLGSGVLDGGEALLLPPPEGTEAGAASCPVEVTAVFRDGRSLALGRQDPCAGGEAVLQ